MNEAVEVFAPKVAHANSRIKWLQINKYINKYINKVSGLYYITSTLRASRVFVC